MDEMEKTWIKIASTAFFLAKSTNNNEDLFVSRISSDLRVHPDDVKRIFKAVKRKWAKKKQQRRK